MEVVIFVCDEYLSFLILIPKCSNIAIALLLLLRCGDTGQANQNALNSFTTKKQTTKFSSANLSKNVNSKLYYIKNSKTREQTV